MRYFVRIQYNGANFNGWQKQPDLKTTIQEYLEQAFSTVFRSPIEIIGCGRTDTGVHAKDYYFHFDLPEDYPHDITKNFNSLSRMLPSSLAILSWCEVHDSAHARFDAISRSYEYIITTKKDVFCPNLSYHYTFKEELQNDILNEAAGILLNFKDFSSFCKSRTDVQHKICDIKESFWYQKDEHTFVYRISANRFLRGMIRLVVGMCLNVNRGKLHTEEVISSLEKKQILPVQWSVPGHALYLMDIIYPYLDRNGEYIGLMTENIS